LDAPIETTGTKGTLTVTGAGAAKLGAIDTGFRTLNAGGSSGGLTAQIGGGVELILTGSTGDDVITASTTDALATTNKLAVDAGAGTDTLVIAAAADVNTAADAARYTNFEKVKLIDTQNLKLLSDDITAVEIQGASSKSYTGLSVDQAKNVTISGNQGTAVTIAGRSTGGTADVLSLDLKSATSTTNVTVAGGVFSGYETVNINASTGTAGIDSTTVFATAADTTAINVTGTADFKATLTSSSTKGVALTSTSTGAITVTGNTAKASTITTGSGNDELTMSTTLGSTYSTGAGNDTIKAVIASLVATGVDDHSYDGGAGTDTLSITTTGATTLTDNHFTGASNLEKILSVAAGNVSVTTGGNFNSAFDTVTYTNAAHTSGTTFVWDSGLYQKATTLAITSDADGALAAEDFTVTTGAGDDTVTFTSSAWVGVAGATSTITISTRAGDDTITLSGIDLASNTTSQAIVITPGTGADTLSLGTARIGAGATASAKITIADGDSLEGSRDKITGYEDGDGTNFADILDFDSSTVGTLATSTDNGVILSHSISDGVALFDDASTYAAELIINSTNLSDVLGYLESNSNSGGNIAFEYDSVGDGANDATMVWNNGTKNSLVELVGFTGATDVSTTVKTALTICVG
jgi:hypothetical protein